MKRMRILNGIILIAATMMLSSCFVAKDYVGPELQELNKLYRTENLPTDSLSMATLSWKEIFTDPYLKRYIEEGLSNNMDIRIAVQQMLAAEAYAKQGRAGYLPALNAGASVTHQELAKNSQFGSFFNGSLDQFELTGNLSWEADIWGKIRSNKRAVQAAYMQSVAGHQAVKTLLVANIATTYYNLLALDAQLNVAQRTVETREKSIETIKSLKDAGRVTQVAVDQYIAQYNQAKALEVDLRSAIFKTENTLNILLGKDAGPIERSLLNNQELTDDIEIGLPSSLLRNRPDVMASEYALINAFELTNVARSNFYPSFTITGRGGFQSLQLDQLLSANSLFANVVGGITQPIFNQRKVKTQYEVAKAQQEQALLQFKKSLLTAGNEVSDALYSYHAETEKINYRKEEVEALRRAESNSEELLNNGYATYLDLLTARQGVLNAELNVIDTKLQQILAVVNLYEALGGGWR